MAIYDPNRPGYVQNENTNMWYKQPTKAAVTSGAQPVAGTLPAVGQQATSVAQPYVVGTPATTATPDEYQQQAFNLSRRQNQGGWSAGLGTLQQALGGRGFKTGESGVADNAIGNYLSQQSEGLGQSSTALAVEGAKNKFLQNFNLDQLNFEKDKWGKEFGASREDQSMQDMLAYMAIMNQNQTTPYAAYWGGLNNAINS
jgi:hypothetical protein